jgi:hypothetical protein
MDLIVCEQMHLKTFDITPSGIHISQSSWVRDGSLSSTFYVSYHEGDNKYKTYPLQKLGFDIVQGVTPVTDYDVNVNRKWKDLSMSLDNVEPEAIHLDLSKKYGASMLTKMQGERRDKIEQLYQATKAALVQHVTKYMEPDFTKLVMRVETIEELYKFQDTFNIITVARNEGKTINDLRAIAEYKQALDKSNSTFDEKIWYRKFEAGNNVFFGFFVGSDTTVTDIEGKTISLKKLVCKRFNASIHIGFPTFNMTVTKEGLPNKIQMRTLVYTMLVKPAMSMSVGFDEMN